MKRIYKNNDLAFNLTINNFPINEELINSVEFRFYTLNNNNYISKSESDIDINNQIVLQWDELKKLEEGVLYYDYTVSFNDDAMNDGTHDTVTKVMTNYFIVTGIDTININNDMDATQYYTKDEVDNLINDVVVGTIDLSNFYTKTEVDNLINNIDIPTQDVDLSNYYTKSEVDNKLENYIEDDVLGSYYTKNEVNELIDNIDVPIQDVDLTNYYTKSEVDSMIPSTEGFITEIPSEYVTDSELTAKGYLTEHQSLNDYYKKSETYSISEVNTLIDGVSASDVDLTNYYTKTEVDNLIPSTDEFITSIPSEYITETELSNSLNGYALTSHTHNYLTSIPSEYVTDSELTAKGYLTEHQSLDDYYTKTEVDNKISASGNFDSTQYYTKTEVDSMIPSIEGFITEIPSEYITESELNDKGYLTEHQSLDGYAKLSDIPSLDGYSLTSHTHEEYLTSIPSEYVTEDELTTSLNGYSTTSHTHSEYITEQYDDTALTNRVSALETELNGVSETITEINNMVV